MTTSLLKVREALEPFATIAKHIPENANDDDYLDEVTAFGPFVKDLRRAATAYESLSHLEDATPQPLDGVTANAARRQAFKEAMAIVGEWFRPGVMRLRAGEMTAQEARTARAILSNIIDNMKTPYALTPCDDAECEQCESALSNPKPEE